MLPNRPGNAGQYLRVLKFRLGVGVVVGHVGPAVAAGDAEVDEELGDRFGGHRRSPVGVQGELIVVDLLAGEGVGDERLGEFTGLGGRHHPPDDVAGEDVDDHEQLVVDAPLGTLQLGYVPRPDLVGSPGDQLGLLLGRVGALAASLTVLPYGCQQPVHGAYRTQVDAVVEKPGPHLGGSQVPVLR